MKTVVDALQHLLNPPYLYFAAIALVCLALLWGMRSYRRSHKGIVPFKSEGGSIEIAPQTLRGVMQNAANSVEGVEKAACRHFVRGRNVGVKVGIHLRANHKLRDVECCIKQRIRSTLSDQFGMEQVEPIHIRVTRIVGEPVASVPEEKEAVDEADISSSYGEDDLPESSNDRPYSDDTRL